MLAFNHRFPQILTDLNVLSAERAARVPVDPRMTRIEGILIVALKPRRSRGGTLCGRLQGDEQPSGTQNLPQ